MSWRKGKLVGSRKTLRYIESYVLSSECLITGGGCTVRFRKKCCRCLTYVRIQKMCRRRPAAWEGIQKTCHRLRTTCVQIQKTGPYNVDQTLPTEFFFPAVWLKTDNGVTWCDGNFSKFKFRQCVHSSLNERQGPNAYST